MTASSLEQLTATIRQAEGLRLKPYTDTVGVLTVGFGRAIGRVGISRDEAEHLLANDIVRVLKGLDLTMPWWRGLDDVRQRALAEMAFQLGLDGLLNFRRMRAALMDGDYERAADEALDSKWAAQTPNRARRVAAMIRTGEG